MREFSTFLYKEMVMQIEIMLDKKQNKPVCDAFHAEINRRVVAMSHDAVVRILQGSHTRIKMPDLKWMRTGNE